MAQPKVVGPTILSRQEYRRWAEAQQRGRYERVEGEVIAMAPERGAHLRVKAAVWLALRQAIAAAGVPCQALPDGATVEIGDGTDYEPDAAVNCGEPMAAEATAIPNPVVVVEVLSPSTRSTDTGVKLTDYFRVQAIQHYLIVRADRPAVIHHRRATPRGDISEADGRRSEAGRIETRLLSEGRIVLDPPGITVEVADFYVA